MNPYDVLEKYKSLYLNNAWFKMGADTAIQILDYTLAGLAIEAEDKQREYELILNEALHSSQRVYAGKFDEPTPVKCS